jgi:hypothetical protein
VETQENPLTSGPERLIVNCGTFFRTRINTGDFAILTFADARRNLESGRREPAPQGNNDLRKGATQWQKE